MMKWARLALGALCIAAVLSPASFAADVILNEYNAVRGSQQLSGSDSFFGQVDGNGGDWFELVVVADHVDMRGWTLNWADDDNSGTVFLSDESFWSDMRRGTIVTIVENDDGGGKNTSTDTSFDPYGGDWWVNVCTRQEQDKFDNAQPWLARTDDGGNFRVTEKDWTLTIMDGTTTVFGPAGEGAAGWAGGGVNDSEVGKLEGPPAPATLAHWLGVTPASGLYDDGDNSTFGAPNTWGADGLQDFTPLRDWVPEPATAAMLLAGLAVLLRRRFGA